MISIKNSFADCSKCKLLESPSCILETNCEKDLSKVDVIFIAENPGKDEIQKQVPLIGRAGQTFRKHFKKFNLDSFNYLITNTVLCLTLDEEGKTGNPDDETIEICKENCFNIIEACNPKLIVVMGTTPMTAFDIATQGITNLRGKVYKWRGYDVLLTIHPSYVNRNRAANEPKFMEDLMQAAEILGGDVSSQAVSNDMVTTGKSGMFSYKIPDKYYTDEYRLVDIHYVNKTKEVLYIFRDKNNKRVFHKENDDYICYQVPKGMETKKILPFDDLIQVKLSYKEKKKLDNDITYEGDIKVGVKHAIDYFMTNKEEAPIVDMNIMYIDIEVYSHNNEFPKPEDAAHPVVILAYEYHGKLNVYAMDHKILFGKDGQKILDSKNASTTTVFGSEKDLLNKFVADLRKLEPDIITGWNFINFDLAYIFNRLKKLGISQQSLSKFGEVYVDGETGYATCTGTTILDQLALYKEFTFGQKENYRLGTIAQLEIDKDKLDEGMTFKEMYEKDVNKSIEYNIRDVVILVELEEKLKHVTLQNELKQICKSTFRGSATPFGRIDALSISYLKGKGFASKNGEHTSGASKFEGAFVKDPIRGIHDWVVDFDFTSLYPSLILTYNIGLNTFAFKFKDTENGYYFNYDQTKLPDKFKIIIDPTNTKKEMTITKEQVIKKVADENLISTISGCFFVQHDKEQSFYSEILDMLLSSRKEYKKKMFQAMKDGDKVLEELYNTRQMVFKILANAMYGVLGNTNFRFFDRDCARSVTLSGQEAIKTSILYGNDFVKALKTGKTVDSIPLTVKEMYGDFDRETPYVITGDTDSLFITYQDLVDKKKSVDENLEQVDKWNRDIETYLNDEIIPEFVSSKKVDMKYNRLNLKNELVVKRGLFLQKKRYSLHVIAQEGTKIDRVTSMGLEIKRSDFPSYTKVCLQELLDIILKTDKVSLNKIKQYVNSKEKDFLERIFNGQKTVAKPVSFTKKIKDYKVIPQGVRGMENWNKLVYNIFTPGSRGYLFKLAAIDLDKAPKEVVDNYNKEFLAKGKKIDVVVLPDEESKLPSYFIPDHKEMLRFCWVDRYSLMLEPMMEVKAKQEVMTF